MSTLHVINEDYENIGITNLKVSLTVAEREREHLKWLYWKDKCPELKRLTNWDIAYKM